MDLSLDILPESVCVSGVFYPIHTDFKYFLKFAKAIKDPNAMPFDFDFMYISDRPVDRFEGLKSLMSFMNPPHPLPRPMSSSLTDNEPLIDYELDADLIYSAFMQVYKIDIIDTPLHWYKFTSLLNGLQGTKLNEVIDLRQYQDNGEKSEYNKKRLELKKAWQIVSDEEKAADDKALQEFNDFIGD